MPGSISNAAPATVLPLSLCSAFSHSRSLPVNANEYKNGESQRGKLADSGRRSWKIKKRMTSTTLATLRTFYNSRRGPQEPFYFYDPWTAHDPTGVATTGRYIVRFDTGWSQSSFIGRLETDLGLMELA